MKRSTLAASVSACLCLAATPLFAAQATNAPATNAPATNAPATNATAAAPANTTNTTSAAADQSNDRCLSDLRAFGQQMDKDGYWLGASGYGYGYPSEAYPMAPNPAAAAAPNPAAPNPAVVRYEDARPGYEIRMLLGSANILARHGQDQACEDTLATTRSIYQTYVADMRSGKYPVANLPNWRQQQLAAAQPVADMKTPFRSDELVGTDVRDPKDNALGSVDDLVMDPRSGKIGYVVISRGGIFGIDKKYVAVPWDDFRITPTGNLLVLDTTKAALDAAPQSPPEQFAGSGNFEQQAKTVDAYWKSHIGNGGKPVSNG